MVKKSSDKPGTIKQVKKPHKIHKHKIGNPIVASLYGSISIGIKKKNKERIKKDIEKTLNYFKTHHQDVQNIPICSKIDRTYNMYLPASQAAVNSASVELSAIVS